MSQNSAELISDNDLETLFDGSAAPPSATTDADGVVRVPVPTAQLQLNPGAEEGQAGPAVPRPKISIQIGGKGATGAGKPAAGPVSRVPVWKRLRGFVTAALNATGDGVYRVCDGALTALHLPFRWLPPVARNLIGGVAIVTCMTATSAMFMGPMLFPRFDANDFVPLPTGGRVHAAQADDGHGHADDDDHPGADEDGVLTTHVGGHSKAASASPGTSSHGTHHGAHGTDADNHAGADGHAAPSPTNAHPPASGDHPGGHDVAPAKGGAPDAHPNRGDGHGHAPANPGHAPDPAEHADSGHAPH